MLEEYSALLCTCTPCMQNKAHALQEGHTQAPLRTASSPCCLKMIQGACVCLQAHGACKAASSIKEPQDAVRAYGCVHSMDRVLRALAINLYLV